MTDDIRNLLDARPFVPFTVHAADGREYHVPTSDHAHVHPGGKRLSIYSDTRLESILPALLLSGVDVEMEAEPTPDQGSR